MSIYCKKKEVYDDGKGREKFISDKLNVNLKKDWMRELEKMSKVSFGTSGEFQKGQFSRKNQ